MLALSQSDFETDVCPSDPHPSLGEPDSAKCIYFRCTQRNRMLQYTVMSDAVMRLILLLTELT
jgi:hypothetical protein